MSDLMTFTKTVDEFMEAYKIVDTEEVYTNGTELVPIFRMKQWFEAHESIPVEWIKKFVNERATNDGPDGWWHCWGEDVLLMIAQWEKENGPDRQEQTP